MFEFLKIFGIIVWVITILFIVFMWFYLGIQTIGDIIRENKNRNKPISW